VVILTLTLLALTLTLTNFPVPNEKWFPNGEDLNLSIPPPLNQLVDVNLERRSVVYEVTLGREIGIEIVQGPFGPAVGSVQAGSKAEQLGLLPG
jgi:hypothetical protein